MFDVNNIKIGDYVETRDGEIGYVTAVNPDGITIFNWKMIDGTDMYTGALCPLNKIFKQIGTYKFDDEKINKKIEKLQLEPKFETRKCDKVTIFANGYEIIEHDTNEEFCTGIEEIPIYKLYSKINEIIDRLNEIE